MPHFHLHAAGCHWKDQRVAARCIGCIIVIEFVTSKMESFKVRHRKVFATKSNPGPSIRNSQTRLKKKRSLCHQEVMEQGSYGKIWLNSCLSKWAVADVNFRNAPNQAANCCCPFPLFPWVRLCVFLKEMFREGLWELCCCAEVLELELPPTHPVAYKTFSHQHAIQL